MVAAVVVVVVVVGLDKCVTDAMSHKCSQPREDAVSTLCHVSRYGATSCCLGRPRETSTVFFFFFVHAVSSARVPFPVLQRVASVASTYSSRF